MRCESIFPNSKFIFHDISTEISLVFDIAKTVDGAGLQDYWLLKIFGKIPDAAILNDVKTSGTDQRRTSNNSNYLVEPQKVQLS
jgi:hypothetical protein